jgi:sulfur carrier protein ThiS
MKITVKLYALLGVYLPPGAADHQAEIELPEDATAFDVMALLKIPPEACHLVLVNGIFLAPGKRPTEPLRDGDALAMWPPVAGG